MVLRLNADYLRGWLVGHYTLTQYKKKHSQSEKEEEYFQRTHFRTWGPLTVACFQYVNKHHKPGRPSRSETHVLRIPWLYYKLDRYNA